MSTTVTPMELLLRKHRACSEAVQWASKFASASEAWRACERPDWMLWALRKLHLNDDRRHRLFACRCVRETPLLDGRKAWDLLPSQRYRNAIEVAERFARGEATVEEWGATRFVLHPAPMGAMSNTEFATADASRAAWYATVSDARLAAREASTEAAQTAWSAAGDSDRDSAWGAAWKAQAAMLREIYGDPFVAMPRRAYVRASMGCVSE